MTSQLQPLDVSINKPFKGYLREEYESWISADDLPLTQSGKIKKASPSLITRLVSTAWAKVSPAMVEKSFKKCCLSNAMDGTEDDLMWEEEENDNLSDDSEGEEESNDDDDNDE